MPVYQTRGVSVELDDESPAAHTIHTEEEVIEDILDNISSDDVFWDVGAAGGAYSVIVKAVTDARCFAYEPHPDNLRFTLGNAKRNELLFSVREIALYNEDGTVTMKENPHANHMVDGEGSLEVNCIRGDNLDPTPNAVKIDVEGREYEVLEGFHDTLRDDRCRLVYCEVHDRMDGISVRHFGHEPEDIEELLEDAGFSTEILLDRGGNYILKAVKED